MAMPFNADEVFEMAEQIERNGGIFYRAAAEKFPGVSKVLLGLAEMEDEHLKTFADMRADLSGTELEEPVFDPDTPEDVLKMAIGVERDSIAFYVGLKEAVSRKAGKDKVDDIIKEEMGHIVTLNEKLQDLM